MNASYNVFGFRYALLGTVNYKLDSDEGGHYVTNLFPNKNELIRIHETDFKTIKRLPDFDVDTVIVALQKVGELITILSLKIFLIFLSQPLLYVAFYLRLYGNPRQRTLSIPRSTQYHWVPTIYVVFQ